MEESDEQLKSLLMKVNKQSEKAGLKLNIQEIKITVLGPITSWQIDEEKNAKSGRFSWIKKSLQMLTAAMKLKDAHFLEEKL